MIQGYVHLKNGVNEDFTIEFDKFNANMNLLHEEYAYFVNLGDLHIAKDQIAYIKILNVEKS